MDLDRQYGRAVILEALYYKFVVSTRPGGHFSPLGRLTGNSNSYIVVIVVVMVVVIVVLVIIVAASLVCEWSQLRCMHLCHA